MGRLQVADKPGNALRLTDLRVEPLFAAMQDAVWGKGLVPASECFEMYGWIDKAPPLVGSEAADADPASSAAQAEQVDKEQALAACLATPFT